MTDSPVRLDREGPLAILTVDKPPREPLRRGHPPGPRGRHRRGRARQARVRCCCAPRAACGPAASTSTSSRRSSPTTAAELWDRGFALVHRIEDLPFPTIFAAHALCLTWGFEIAMACDLLLAAEGAKFGLVETVVGLTPAMGGTQRLAERAGPARASEFVMTGALYDAATLERWNVVNRVWPDDAFAEKARKFADRLANGPTLAHAATKAIVRAQKEGGARAADAITPKEAGDLFGTQDLKQAVQTFLKEGPGNATYEGS